MSPFLLFCFFAYKNYNIKVAILAADMVAILTFLSYISLVVFFSIADVGVAAVRVSGWLYILVFVFPLIKIATQR